MQSESSNSGPERGAAQPFFNAWRVGLVAVFLISAVLYFPSLRGLPVWDDHGILSGKTIGKGTFEGAFTEPFNLAYFRPLTSLSYLLDRQLFGQSPFFYHQTNVLLHALSAVLVAWLGLLLFKSRRAGLLMGILFAVQPAQTAAVSWIGARTDLLGVVFATLFAGWLYLHLETRRARWLILSAMAFFLGLLAKEQLASLFLIVPVAAFVVGRHNWKGVGLVSLPYVLAGIAFAALWVRFYPEPYPLGWAGWGEQVHRVGATFLHYLGLILVPTPVGMHALSLANYERTFYAVAGFVLMVGAVAACVRISRSSPAGLFVVVFVLLTYLPISNLVPIPSLLVGPYRAAIVGVGAALLLGLGLARLSQTKPALGYVGSGAYVALCAAFSLWGIRSWASEIDFFGSVAKYDPHSIVNRMNVATARTRKLNFRGTLRDMDEILDYVYQGAAWRDRKVAAMGLSNRDVEARIVRNQGTRAEASGSLSGMFYMRAFALDNMGRTPEAMEALELALEIEPRHALAHCLLGEILEAEKPGSGLRRLRIASRLGADFPMTWVALGSQRLRNQDFKEAARCFENALELSPSDGMAGVLLAEARIGLGDARGALKALAASKGGIALPGKREQIEAKARRLLEGNAADDKIARVR